MDNLPHIDKASAEPATNDRELARILELVEKLDAVHIVPTDLSDQQARDIYGTLGVGRNKINGDIVHFVKTTFNKIRKHQGVNVKLIITQLRHVFENSVPIYNEPERVMRGHKQHDNFVGYRNYLGKVRINGTDYFVRFTAQELKPSWKNKEKIGKLQLHSTAISHAILYEKSGPSVTTDIITTATMTATTFIDAKLQHFLASATIAKEKILDE
jgi:hypothetical protein